jgi:SPW repeat
MGAGVPAPRDWRQDLVGASGIVVLLGLWLIFSPLLLGYGSDDADWNPVACGVVATVVALVGAIRRARAAIPGWLLMAIGVWLFASGFWLAESSQASWNARGAGALMFFLGSVSVAAAQRTDRV